MFRDLGPHTLAGIDQPEIPKHQNQVQDDVIWTVQKKRGIITIIATCP